MYTAQLWKQHVEQLGAEHKMILQNTLPTISFRLLLEHANREIDKQLVNLDTSREPEDFKWQYRLLKQEQELHKSLLDFLNSLTPTGNNSNLEI